MSLDSASERFRRLFCEHERRGTGLAYWVEHSETKKELVTSTGGWSHSRFEVVYKLHRKKALEEKTYNRWGQGQRPGRENFRTILRIFFPTYVHEAEGSELRCAHDALQVAWDECGNTQTAEDDAMEGVSEQLSLEPERQRRRIETKAAAESRLAGDQWEPAIAEPEAPVPDLAHISLEQFRVANLPDGSAPGLYLYASIRLGHQVYRETEEGEEVLISLTGPEAPRLVVQAPGLRLPDDSKLGTADKPSEFLKPVAGGWEVAAGPATKGAELSEQKPLALLLGEAEHGSEVTLSLLAFGRSLEVEKVGPDGEPEATPMPSDMKRATINNLFRKKLPKDPKGSGAMVLASDRARRKEPPEI